MDHEDAEPYMVGIGVGSFNESNQGAFIIQQLVQRIGVLEGELRLIHRKLRSDQIRDAVLDILNGDAITMNVTFSINKIKKEEADMTHENEVECISPKSDLKRKKIKQKILEPDCNESGGISPPITTTSRRRHRKRKQNLRRRSTYTTQTNLPENTETNNNVDDGEEELPIDQSEEITEDVSKSRNDEIETPTPTTLCEGAESDNPDDSITELNPHIFFNPPSATPPKAVSGRCYKCRTSSRSYCADCNRFVCKTHKESIIKCCGGCFIKTPGENFMISEDPVV